MPEIIDGMSMDLAAANMDKFKSVFPECFAEGKLNNSETINWEVKIDLIN